MSCFSDPVTVDRVQSGYVSLLYRYLRWTYGADGARLRLGGTVAVWALAREAHDIMERGATGGGGPANATM